MTLCEHDIPVVVAPLVGLPEAITQGLHSNRSHVRQQQVLRRNDADIMGEASRSPWMPMDVSSWLAGES